jgi:hypothetical protein
MTARHDSNLTSPLGRHHEGPSRHDVSKMTARLVRSARIWATFSPTRRGALTCGLQPGPALALAVAVTTSTIWWASPSRSGRCRSSLVVENERDGPRTIDLHARERFS